MYASSIRDTSEQLPAELAHPVEEGIGQALAVAGQIGDPGLAEAAQQAFLDGWSVSMFVAAAAAVVGGIAVRGLARTGTDAPASPTTERELVTAA